MSYSEDHCSPNALARKTSVRELVATFQAAEDAVRQCFAELDAQQDKLAAVFSMGQGSTRIYISATDRVGHSDWSPRSVERTIVDMRREAWKAIVDRLEIRRALSPSRAIAMNKALDEETPPEVTEPSVHAFVARWAAELPQMIEEAIVEVFNWLRPRADSHRGSYKTNQKNARFELGERIVLCGIVRRGWREKSFRLYEGLGTWDPVANLRALENVFTALDGAGQFSRQARSAIELAVDASVGGTWETPYFAGRCFRNCNMHLRFKRLDLLAEFNRRAGGMNLRAGDEGKQ